jgi:hypothetical protein
MHNNLAQPAIPAQHAMRRMPDGRATDNHPHAGIPGLDPSFDDFADLDTDDLGLGLRQLPSTGSLSHQLRMTHVGSNGHLAGMDQSTAINSQHAQVCVTSITLEWWPPAFYLRNLHVFETTCLLLMVWFKCLKSSQKHLYGNLEATQCWILNHVNLRKPCIV